MALWKLRLMLAMLLLLAGGARAQDVFNAGATVQTKTVGDSFSSSCIQAQKPNIWKQLGVNPLTCHPQGMAEDSTKQCTLKGATLVAHQGTTCYYCEPSDPPTTLYIPMDQVENASLQGYSCGESPVDPGCMSLCSREFPSTTTYVPPVAQPVVPALQNGQDTGDPCHPYYDFSTAAGIAAMRADAPRVAAACNALRCQHNPELTVCKNVNLQASVPATSEGVPGPGPGQGGVSGPDFIREWVRRPKLPPVHPTKYAPLDWIHVPKCPDPTPSAAGGPYINYFWLGDPHAYGMGWISDSRYITVGGHGGVGAQGLGSCSASNVLGLIPPRQIAADVHTLLMRPENAGKKVRLAACQTADANPRDPNSVPTAQQVADAYRELYGNPISVEGYSGDVQFQQASRLQNYPCRVFTSRPPLPAPSE